MCLIALPRSFELCWNQTAQTSAGFCHEIWKVSVYHSVPWSHWPRPMSLSSNVIAELENLQLCSSVCSILSKTCLSHPCKANVHYDIKHELSMLIQFRSSSSHVKVSLSKILNTPPHKKKTKKQNWSPGASWCDCCLPLLYDGLNAKVKFQCMLYE